MTRPQKLIYNVAFLAFAAMVLGMLIQDRNFAHLGVRLHGVTFYVTEGLLLLCLLGLLASKAIHCPNVPAPWALIVLALSFLFSFVRGALIYNFQDAVRDGMILGYGVVILVTYSFYQGKNDLYPGLLRGMAILALFALAFRYVAVWGDLLIPWYIPLQPACSAMYFSGVLLFVTLFMPRDVSLSRRRMVQMALVSLLILITVRTAWLAWAILLVMAWFLNKWKMTFPDLRGFVRVVLPVSLMAAVLLSLTQPRYLFIILMRDLRSAVLPLPSLAGDSFGNVRTRLWIWKDVVKEISTARPVPLEGLKIVKEYDSKGRVVSGPFIPPGGLPSPKDVPAGNIANAELKERARKDPMATPTAIPQWPGGQTAIELSKKRNISFLLGFPMGKPLIPEHTKNWMDEKRFDPHNSLVAILYRMGLIGVFSFLLWFVALMIRTFQRLDASSHEIKERLLIWAFWFALYGFFHMQSDVTLESPFKAVFFWIAMGLCLTSSDKQNA